MNSIILMCVVLIQVTNTVNADIVNQTEQNSAIIKSHNHDVIEDITAQDNIVIVKRQYVQDDIKDGEEDHRGEGTILSSLMDVNKCPKGMLWTEEGHCKPPF
ncbi:hypothetical protein JYU34_007553 [Plutella xylostella]|uniref:Uncharacterized protein n=1 Tax=Plutella xylostella TaxID=51655 RepID=A0ABQ7QQM8_PLUXY|nr:hypothetical protein JYU34_007553 [Plutella xylostella]